MEKIEIEEPQALKAPQVASQGNQEHPDGFETKKSLLESNPKLELKENNKEKDKTKGKDKEPDISKVDEVKLIEKVVYVPSTGYESKLFEGLALFGKHRPVSRMEIEKEDITQKVIDVVNQVVQISSSIKEPESNQFSMYDDGLGQLFHAKKAYIDQYYELKDFFVMCPLILRYHISLDFKLPGKPAYHLFDLKEFSSQLGRDFCPNQSRSINIDMNQIPLNSSKGPKTKFASITKPFRCAFLCFCACCTRPEFNVTLSTHEFIGKVVELKTTCDPIIVIYDVNNTVDWRITTKFCKPGYYCRDFCMGKCSECEFNIYNGRDEIMLHPCGKINKRTIYGRREKPDVDQIEIEFPVNANAKEKLVLIVAGLMVEYLYFQNVKNGKRCHGESY